MRWLALLAPLALVMCSSKDEPAPDLAKLDPPPSGQGFQFGTEETTVPAASEIQDCYFYKVSELAASNGLPADQPVYLHRIQTAQRDGSHHMNIFRVKTIKGLDPNKERISKGLNGNGECFKSPNWADWPLVANTQIDGTLDWTYPEGVALELQPDEWIMLQSHYVNGSSQKTPTGLGKVNVNFWTMPKDKVTAQLGTLFATKQSIRVCSKNPNPTYDGSCQFKSGTPVTVIGANAHFHSRGKKFEMFSWDGKGETRPTTGKFYESTNWEEPPMARSPELNAAIPANGGVWYSCEFQWKQPAPEVGCDGLNKYDTEKYQTKPEALDCCYTFGPVVDKNEHCNVFVYYYPKQDDVNCF